MTKIYPRRPPTPTTGEYYAEFDEPTGLYCVFHSEGNGYAYSSWSSLWQAEEDAQQRNRERVKQ